MDIYKEKKDKTKKLQGFSIIFPSILVANIFHAIFFCFVKIKERFERVLEDKIRKRNKEALWKPW